MSASDADALAKEPKVEPSIAWVNRDEWVPNAEGLTTADGSRRLKNWGD